MCDTEGQDQDTQVMECTCGPNEACSYCVDSDRWGDHFGWLMLDALAEILERGSIDQQLSAMGLFIELHHLWLPCS